MQKLSTRNSVFINGKRMTEEFEPLNDGDEFTIIDRTFRYERTPTYETPKAERYSLNSQQETIISDDAVFELETIPLEAPSSARRNSKTRLSIHPCNPEEIETARQQMRRLSGIPNENVVSSRPSSRMSLPSAHHAISAFQSSLQTGPGRLSFTAHQLQNITSANASSSSSSSDPEKKEVDPLKIVGPMCPTGTFILAGRKKTRIGDDREFQLKSPESCVTRNPCPTPILKKASSDQIAILPTPKGILKGSDLVAPPPSSTKKQRRISFAPTNAVLFTPLKRDVHRKSIIRHTPMNLSPSNNESPTAYFVPPTHTEDEEEEEIINETAIASPSIHHHSRPIQDDQDEEEEEELVNVEYEQDVSQAFVDSSPEGSPTDTLMNAVSNVLASSESDEAFDESEDQSMPSSASPSSGEEEEQEQSPVAPMSAAPVFASAIADANAFCDSPVAPLCRSVVEETPTATATCDRLSASYRTFVSSLASEGSPEPRIKLKAKRPRSRSCNGSQPSTSSETNGPASVSSAIPAQRNSIAHVESGPFGPRLSISAKNLVQSPLHKTEEPFSSSAASTPLSEIVVIPFGQPSTPSSSTASQTPSSSATPVKRLFESSQNQTRADFALPQPTPERRRSFTSLMSFKFTPDLNFQDKPRPSLNPSTAFSLDTSPQSEETPAPTVTIPEETVSQPIVEETIAETEPEPEPVVESEPQITQQEQVQVQEQEQEQEQHEEIAQTENVMMEEPVTPVRKSDDAYGSRRSLPSVFNLQPLTPNVKSLSKTPNQMNRKKRLEELEKDLIEVWRAVRDAKDENGKVLCSHFLTTKAVAGHRLFSQSSSRSSHISPVTMETIYAGVVSRRYGSVEALIKDFQKMFSQSALVFPDPSSEAHQHNILLSQLVDNFVASYQSGEAPLQPFSIPSSFAMVDDHDETPVQQSTQTVIEEVVQEQVAVSDCLIGKPIEAESEAVVSATLDLEKEIDEMAISTSAVPEIENVSAPAVESMTCELVIPQQPEQQEEEQKQEEQKTCLVDYSSMTVVQLKAILKKRGLSYAGRKTELVERLEESDKTTTTVEEIAEEPAPQEEQAQLVDEVVIISKKTPKREARKAPSTKAKSVEERPALSDKTNTVITATPKRTKAEAVPVEKTPKKSSRKSVTPKPEFNEEELQAMTVVQLKKILKAKELDLTGRKQDLIVRLLQI